MQIYALVPTWLYLQLVPTVWAVKDSGFRTAADTADTLEELWRYGLKRCQPIGVQSKASSTLDHLRDMIENLYSSE